MARSGPLGGSLVETVAADLGKSYGLWDVGVMGLLDDKKGRLRPGNHDDRG